MQSLLYINDRMAAKENESRILERLIGIRENLSLETYIAYDK